MRVQLHGVKNIPTRRSASDAYFATVKVDGSVKGQTKATTGTFSNEYYDIQVDRAHEVEICLYEQSTKALLSVIWFNLHNLEEDLKVKYSEKYPDQMKSISDVNEVWLDMEPGGQVLLKALYGTGLSLY